MWLPRSHLTMLGVLLVASQLFTPVDSSAIMAKGNKFFDIETGAEFRIKGVAYFPRPNDGPMYGVNNYDWAADEHESVWSTHIEIFKDLGVNTIRLYSIDPTKSHDKFMCACAQAGIYILVGVTAPCEDCSIIDEEPPKCYPDALLTRAMMVYNAFAVYDNTLGFSVGNENNLQMQHGGTGTTTAPCVKAFLRDVRNYAAKCHSTLRSVPIGLDIADIPPRGQWLEYYDCTVDGKKETRAEWIGFNPYVECDPVGHTTYAQSTGLQALMQEYAATKYSNPIMFGEYGCNLGKNTIDGFENQRGFRDAKWMNEETEMTSEIVGGNVFEFVTERIHVNNGVLGKAGDPGKFGIGYFTPIDCDHDKIPCQFVPYPEYDNLKKAYTTTKASKVKMNTFKPTNTATLKCPSTMSTKLPSTPKVEQLECSARRPVCSTSSPRATNDSNWDASEAIKLRTALGSGSTSAETPIIDDNTAPLSGSPVPEVPEDIIAGSQTGQPSTVAGSDRNGAQASGSSDLLAQVVILLSMAISTWAMI